jgi:uncharacterized protein (TIGR01244 family)
MTKLASLILVAAVAFAQPGAAQKLVKQDSVRALPAPVIMDTTGMFQARYARVGDDFFIGGQPTEKALRELKALGVTTVVNLRTPPEMGRIGFDEEKLVKELGMKYVYLPSRSGQADFAYSPNQLRKFTEAMMSADGKVLLHCTIAWRASHLWAAYLIERGVPIPEVLTHARAINLMDDHRMDAGVQPIEAFLGRKVPGLGTGGH